MALKPVIEARDNIPAYRTVASKIEAMVANGELTPGDPLPNETDLAQQFGVNRSTIRESLRLLEDTGYVVRISPRKLTVALPATGALSQRTSRAMWVNRVTIRDIWEAVLGIEPAMARAAAKRATKAQLAALQRNVAETIHLHQNGKDLRALDDEFHALLGEACNNRALIIAREPIKALFLPTVERLIHRIDTTGDRLVKSHQRILEAIERGDSEIAALWTARHLEDFERGCKLAGVDMSEVISVFPIEGQPL